MAPVIAPVQTSLDFPPSTTVVVIGGGIIGLTAALTLAERGISVVVLEKGRIAAEQSSRNLGWIRKTGRDKFDLPLSVESDRLWSEMPQRVGADVGYSQAGIMYVARTESEMAGHETWIKSVGGQSLDFTSVEPGEHRPIGPGRFWQVGRRNFYTIGRARGANSREQRDCDGGYGKRSFSRRKLRCPYTGNVCGQG